MMLSEGSSTIFPTVPQEISEKVGQKGVRNASEDTGNSCAETSLRGSSRVHGRLQILHFHMNWYGQSEVLKHSEYYSEWNA